MLIYRKWNGAFESALIVKNGKGIKRVLLTKFAPRFKKASFEGEDEVCGTFDLLEWFVDCEYEGDNPVPISCSEPYSVVIGQIDIPCPEDDPEYDPCLLPENFELCFPGETPGGGGPSDTDNSYSLTYDNEEESLESGSVTQTTVNGDVYREWFETWQFAKATEVAQGNTYVFYGNAIDILKTKQVGSGWEWVSCVNSSVYTSGLKPAYVDIVKDGYAVTFIADANVSLAWHVRRTGSLTWDSPPKTAKKSFPKK